MCLAFATSLKNTWIQCYRRVILRAQTIRGFTHQPCLEWEALPPMLIDVESPLSILVKGGGRGSLPPKLMDVEFPLPIVVKGESRLPMLMDVEFPLSTIVVVVKGGSLPPLLMDVEFPPIHRRRQGGDLLSPCSWMWSLPCPCVSTTDLLRC